MANQSKEEVKLHMESCSKQSRKEIWRQTRAWQIALVRRVLRCGTVQKDARSRVRSVAPALSKMAGDTKHITCSWWCPESFSRGRPTVSVGKTLPGVLDEGWHGWFFRGRGSIFASMVRIHITNRVIGLRFPIIIVRAAWWNLAHLGKTWEEVARRSCPNYSRVTGVSQFMVDNWLCLVYFEISH